MATKDSGKRGSRKQASPRRAGQTDTDTGVPGTSETAGAGGTRRRGRSVTTRAAATEPQAPSAESKTPAARRTRKPRAQAAEAGAAPLGEQVARQEEGAVSAPPVSVTAAPEAAVAGSAEPVSATLPHENLPPTDMTSEVHGYELPPTAAPPSEGILPPPTPNAALAEAVREEERAAGLTAVPGAPRAARRERARVSHSNALGMLIERHFGDAMSPCRSYSDLERRSGISREALSRYVTARPDRRRSPTIDTLVAIADAMHLSLESVCRAAAASVKGMPLAADEELHAREEVLSALVSGLTDQQFSAVVELLRHLRPVVSTTER